ncbi:hypothetical protein ACFXAZ_36360 [Streptomyces sp. NPDC059477]|uniref:hypothetical protein n=1 Tax=Streptomyces sp. NPDC059477 TaxID=3346847 RepID=UPI0036C27A11
MGTTIWQNRSTIAPIARDDDLALLHRITAPTLLMAGVLGQEMPTDVARGCAR